jgi:hypothetical protein
LAPGCGTSERSSEQPEPARDPASELAVEASSAATTAFPWTDVTTTAGLDGFRHHNGATGRHLYVETMGPGVALFDADGDEDVDLYVVDGGPLPPRPDAVGPGNRLYLNRGDGTFEDATAQSGADDRGYGMGVAVGDYDGDGDPDLYVLNYGPNALYRNAGGGRFERVDAGVEDPSWSVSGAFFDYDADADLDLYVANYLRYDVRREQPCKAGTLEIYCSPEQYPPAPDRLYRNDGGGRFTDVSREAGVAEDGRGMGVAAGDVDGDGDQDLYVANDRTRNFLYRNDRGRLREIGGEAGVAYALDGAVEGGMGVVIADLVGAGPSIFVTNFQKEPNRLYVPAGDGFFDDWSLRSGLGHPSMEPISWGIAALDVEADGDLDLAVANGHVFENAAAFIPGSSWEQADQLFVNRGDGGFDAVEFPPPHLSSRGLADGDLDGDGDRDLVVASCGGGLRVWRNDAGSPERWLVVRLVGRSPNTSAYGAVLEAEVGGRSVRREVTSGGSYASHSDPRIHLGLGGAAAASALRLRWPDGTVEEAGEEHGGQLLIWRQGEGIVERKELAAT